MKTVPTTLSTLLATGTTLALATAAPAASVSVSDALFDPDSGETTIDIPVMISGGEALTDLVALVQVGDGGTVAGNPAQPQITALSLVGSIWDAAPGGFTQFFGDSATPASLIDPSISLNETGETVAADGLLFTLTLDPTGFAPGSSYTISLADTAGGSTQAQASGDPVDLQFDTGVLDILLNDDTDMDDDDDMDMDGDDDMDMDMDGDDDMDMDMDDDDDMDMDDDDSDTGNPGNPSVIPTPSAVMAGLLMLTGLATRRRRR